jgi:hypothetical protein
VFFDVLVPRCACVLVCTYGTPALWTVVFVLSFES